jgi:hypothetical protein
MCIGIGAGCLSVTLGSGVAFAERPEQQKVQLGADDMVDSGERRDEPSLDYDDFSVPDDASFEPLWDVTAYPDLKFTAPGCALDFVAGRRVNELGSSWFVGAFVAFPLGGRCLGSLRAPSVAHEGDELRPRAIRAAAVVPSESDEQSGGLHRQEEDAAGGARPEASATPSPVPGEATQSTATLIQTPAAQGETPRADAAPTSHTTPGFVAELVRRIRSLSGADLHLGRLDKLARQERASGLLPEVRLRGAHGVDESLALDSVGNFSGETSSRGGSDSVVEARLTFHLERLLAPQSSTSLERLRQSVLEHQEQQVELGLELLATVSEAEALLMLEELTDAERVKHAARGRAARIRLHVLTGGWFPIKVERPPAK